MLKVFNLSCVRRSHGAVALTRCNYSTDKGNKPNNDTTFKDDTPIEPLQLSYNSYEDLSSDSTTPPVIIMHGEHGKSIVYTEFFQCFNILLVYFSLVFCPFDIGRLIWVKTKLAQH